MSIFQRNYKASLQWLIQCNWKEQRVSICSWFLKALYRREAQWTPHQLGGWSPRHCGGEVSLVGWSLDELWQQSTLPLGSSLPKPRILVQPQENHQTPLHKSGSAPQNQHSHQGVGKSEKLSPTRGGDRDVETKHKAGPCMGCWERRTVGKNRCHPK